MSKKTKKLCKGFNKATKEEINSMENFLNSSYATNTRYDDEDEYPPYYNEYEDENEEDEYYASEVGRNLFGDPSYRYGTPIKEVIKQKKEAEEISNNKYVKHEKKEINVETKKPQYIVTPHDEFGLKINLDVRDPNLGHITCSIQSRRSSLFLNGLRIENDGEVDYFNFNKVKDLYDTTDNMQPIVTGIFRLIVFSSTPDIIIKEEDIEELTDNVKSFSNENVFIDYRKGEEEGEGFYYVWTIDSKSREKYVRFITAMMAKHGLLSTAVQVLQYSCSGFNGIIPVPEVSDYVSSLSEVEDFIQYLEEKSYVTYKENPEEKLELNSFSDGLEHVSMSLVNAVNKYARTPKNSGQGYKRENETYRGDYTENTETGLEEEEILKEDKATVEEIRSSMEEFGQVYEEDDDEDKDSDEDDTQDLSIYQMSGEGYEEEGDGDLMDDDLPAPEVKEEEGKILFKPLHRKG